MRCPVALINALVKTLSVVSLQKVVADPLSTSDDIALNFKVRESAPSISAYFYILQASL